MGERTRKQLIHLQQTLYERAYESAQSQVTINSPSLREYREEFNNSLPSTFKRVRQNNLLTAMSKGIFALYGDFHTLKQSQKGLLRILRGFRRKFPNKEVILTVEMFFYEHQAVLDRYLEGVISETEFLEQCDYCNNWGFPWSHYKPVLDYCVEERIKVYGINSLQSEDSLVKRDQFCAEKMTALSLENRDALIICMIGEHHLADNHLPQQLRKECKKIKSVTDVVRIIANIDKFSLKSSPSYIVPPTEYLYLKKNFYCIINTPLWIKWHSYVLWEEMRNVDDWEDLDDDADLYNEDSFDVDYQIHTLSKDLLQFLEITNGKHDLTNFHTFLNPDQETMERIKIKCHLTNTALTAIMERISIDGLYFLPQENIFLITDITLNNIASGVGQFLSSVLSDKNDMRRSYSVAEKFIDRVLMFTVGMIASKILNPRRQGTDIWSFRYFLNQNRGKRLVGHAKVKRDAAYSVIRFHQWISLKLMRDKSGYSLPPKEIIKKDQDLCYEISKSLGDMLGYTLYSRVMGHSAPPGILKKVFFTYKASRKSLIDTFYELYNVIMH